ncbi:hypothetical protein TRFO_17894 [Tritrichomonas foetus]|uniref:Cullin family profile domain-containing protein n=1 Tax=Tritrichomonas foetus TaxID=1144522 RepID=A0A1J4KLY6_9EUKA|nr:hypothetical protein TRFO_17894 [Tritrichomonas foetus]|eukprot:OHT12313.1 hypothetical protein TRFO_17894 [Tritrichomonas foetus]
MTSSANDNVIRFLSIETHEFSIPKNEIDQIFSHDPNISQRSTSIFFGSVNRALRKYCIVSSEYITMMKQYGFIPAILSAWTQYFNSLSLLSDQIGQIFEEKTVHDITNPPGLITQKIKNQVVHFGFKNWKKYVLDLRFIAEELPSSIQLIGESPAKYPFINISFVDHTLNLLELLPNEEEKFTEREFYLANLIAQYIHLFLKHPLLYPPEIKKDIKNCAMLADTLFINMKYSFKTYTAVKKCIITNLNSMKKFLRDFEPKIPENYSLFDNYEYINLLKMVCQCNPEEYIKNIIPGQINYFPKYEKTSELQFLLPFLNNNVLPLYERVMSIIEGNQVAITKFSELFCKKMLPHDKISKESFALFGKLSPYLHCVWRITENLPQYVITLSNAFINHFKVDLKNRILSGKEEEVQEIVATINGLVDGEFHHHPTMVLARSTLFIPHQKDSELVGRARVLVEQAHNPTRKNYSIAELFDIVPFVKNRRELFKGIADFVQNQLLSQADPSVELERTLIDSMGQYTESEYIAPLQSMLKEFAERYDNFKRISKTTSFPCQMKIAVLSNLRWKQIVRRGKLPFFDEFKKYREIFESKFKENNQNSSLIWCDPSSVVEVKLPVNGRDMLFLFNGVQYTIVRILFAGASTYANLVKYIHVEDLQEQLSTLVDAGLVKKHPQAKDTYYFSFMIDPRMNRNFAKKYTSAENIAIMQMKEFDRKKAVNSMIVRLLKKCGPQGMKVKEIVKFVSKESIEYFTISKDVIREQIRELEITKYIKFKPDDDDILIYCP